MSKIAYILQFIFPKYTKLVSAIFLFVLLSTLFGLGSFTLVMPFLGILFKTSPPVDTFMPWSFDWVVLKNNLYYYLSQISESDPSKALVFVSVLMIGLVFLKTGFLYLSKYFMAPVRNGVMRDLRNKIYHKILRLHLGYFSDERKGDIISRTTSDVQEIEVSIVGSLAIIFKDPLSILLSVGLLITMSLKLTIIAFIVLPLAGFIIGTIGKSLRRKSFKAQNKLGELISIIEETLGGLRIVQAFNAQKKVSSKFEEENDRYTNILNSVWRRRDLAVPASEFLATTAIVILLMYGGSLILSGNLDMPAEEFITFIIIFSQVIQPVKDISNAWYSILKGMASIDRINKILDAEIQIQDEENARNIKEFKSNIEFKNLSFRYQEDYVLKEINLKLEKGKTLALVGQSGSGKSTLVNLIPRFYEVNEGEILLDGTDIRKYKLHDLRELMGIVNQESVLFNDTLFNNIAFGVEATTEEQVIQAAKIANAHDFIMEFPGGYNYTVGDRGEKLSGGQRQRISIARAILANPPVLILDEATSALDTESERLVQDALNNLMKNRSSIVIAHRLSTIVNADEICVLHEGRIVEQGKHDELMQLNGAYRKLHEMQAFK